MIKILYCSLKYEYGNPEWGLASIDYLQFFGSLQQMPAVEVEHFAFDEKMRELGRDGMNQALIDKVLETKPDLLFTFLFTEEIKKETIEYITKKTSTKTLNWFADDNWRFPVFSKFWTPLFTAVTTTDSLAFEKYKVLGLNAIKTMWGANTILYKPQDPSKDPGTYKITFVGKSYGKRNEYIKILQKHKLHAQGFGKGWSSGVISFEKMLEIFSFSKINLNFSESPFFTIKDKMKALAKLFVSKELGEYKLNVKNFTSNLESAIQGQRRTIKTRTFEIPACGGFLLTGKPDEDISPYYTPGKEIEVYSSLNELKAKCEYYLNNEQARNVIAKAGYERTIKDHSYIQRFFEIFKKMGLQ
jgi:spore maturation protein CgeB